MHSPETLSKIASYRARVRSGEKLSLKEMQEIVILLRGDRAKALQPKAGSKTTAARKAASGKPNVDDLLGELNDL